MPAKPRGTRAAPKAKRATPRAGRSADAIAERRRQFVERYLANGHNAAAAAVAAGFSPKGAKKTGWQLLHEPDVAQAIQGRARELARLAELTTEQWAAQLRAVLFASPGDLFGTDGNLIPIHLLPPHVQAAISSLKFKNGALSEIKLWDKNSALVTAGKHLGLFERDNEQTRPNIRVQVEFLD